MRRSQDSAQGVNSDQLLPTPTKSRRTCAQQNANTIRPDFTCAMAL